MKTKTFNEIKIKNYTEQDLIRIEKELKKAIRNTPLPERKRFFEIYDSYKDDSTNRESADSKISMRYFFMDKTDYYKENKEKLIDEQLKLEKQKFMDFIENFISEANKSEA